MKTVGSYLLFFAFIQSAFPRANVLFEKRNDYAVALLYVDRSNDAVELLQKLEAETPGNYSVAANLGTAFELSGFTAETDCFEPG